MMDTANDVNTLVQAETNDVFGVYYLRTSYGPNWKVTDGSKFHKPNMWRRSVTPRTTFGFTLRQDKRCNKWFNHTYQEFLTNFYGPMAALAHNLDKVDFKMEYFSAAAAHADKQYVILPRCYLLPEWSQYPGLNQIQAAYPSSKCIQSFILSGDITVSTTFALRHCSESYGAHLRDYRDKTL